MTIPIDRHYIPGFTLETVFLDKDTGEPMAGGKVYFYQDDQRLTLKDVYQITGTAPDYNFVPLPNPVILSAIGTFEDALGNPQIPYFYPFDADGEAQYYWISVYNADDVHQFDRESQPYIPDLFTESEEAQTFSNEIMNPQFTEVLFDTNAAHTITFNPAPSGQVIAIAPGWDLVVSGAINCTVTLNRVAPVGSLNLPTNPAFLLDINSTGVTSLALRQRIYGSPGVFANEYVATMLLGRSVSGAAETVTVQYIPSNPVVAQTLLTATLPANGSYVIQPDVAPFNVLIAASSSTQFAPNSYVDINLVLPTNKNIQLSSIQVVSTGDLAVTGAVPYDQTTAPRQQAYMFDYYQPQINFKPIPSMLTGWDFPLNPAQELGTSVTVTATAAYAWDQTIMQRVKANMAVVRNTITGGLQVTTANANDSFMVMQYLSGEQAKKILGTKLAVNVSGFKGSVGTEALVRAYLYRGSSAAVFPVLPLLIGSQDASGNGVFTKNGTAGEGADWTLINRGLLGALGQAYGYLPTATTGAQIASIIDLQFNGWDIITSSEVNDTDKFCIIVTVSCPTSGTVVTLNSISVVPGDIATRPAPQTLDQVRRECEYYYESSYPVGVASPTATEDNTIVALQNYTAGTFGVTPDNLYARSFTVEYKTTKRTAITPVLYSGVGVVADTIEGYILRVGSIAKNGITTVGNWNVVFNGEKSATFQAATSAAIFSPIAIATPPYDGYISYHYIADARLGIV